MAKHMMNKLNKNLSEALELDPIDTKITEVLPAQLSKTEVIEDDSNFARQNIRDLIEKGNIAIDNLLHVAKESEHPRAYEVAAGLIKTIADANKDLLDVQKKRQDLTGEKQSKNMNIDKAVFVGSTSELVKFLKNNKGQE
jgi:hypothetical protein